MPRKEKSQKLLELVRTLTGAKSVIIVLGDQEMPCEEVKKGGECAGGHTFTTYFLGLRQQDIGDVLHYCAHKEMAHGDERVDESLKRLFGDN